MKKKYILLIICIVFVFIIIIYRENVQNTLCSLSYFTKANEKYVSKTYNMEVVSYEMWGKNYYFYGYDKVNKKNLYVIYEYPQRDIYTIYEEEGISKDKTIEMLEAKGIEVKSISIILWGGENPRSDYSSIKNSLYWFVNSDGEVKDMIYVSFITGNIVKRD